MSRPHEVATIRAPPSTLEDEDFVPERCCVSAFRSRYFADPVKLDGLVEAMALVLAASPPSHGRFG